MGAGIVMLRETFEASLVVGIVLAFLDRTGRRDRFRYVWLGAGTAAAVSVSVAVALFVLGGELAGTAETGFEAATLLTAAVLLTWMIFWMRKQARTIKRELELRAQAALDRGSGLGLALVAFVGVLREGVESSLLLIGASENASRLASTIGGAGGLVIAVLLGYLFYRGSGKLDLRRFFTVTSVLLLLFAAWLLARGLGAVAEAGLLPESRWILVAAFLALALPTLWAFLRKPRAKPIVP